MRLCSATAKRWANCLIYLVSIHLFTINDGHMLMYCIGFKIRWLISRMKMQLLVEAQLLQRYFASIPRTTEASGTCNVIDFDDAMYHWYAMDIEQALDSLHDYIPPEMFARKKQCFMDGYLTEYNLSDDFAAILPACRRFANLYGYTRIRRSIAEQWDNEPEWLVHLRGKLTSGLKDRSSLFGMDIGVENE